MSAWMSATARRSELAEYARLEYSRADSARIESGEFGKFEAKPTGGEATNRVPATAHSEPPPTREEGPGPVKACREPSANAASAAVLSYGGHVLVRPSEGPRNV
jgi:hypothetical protein